MSRFIKSAALALILSGSGFAAHAGQVLNTIPLNTWGQPVSSHPVTTSAGLLRNTTITSSLNVSHTLVTTSAGLLRNTTIASSLNVPHTVVTTTAGLLANSTLTPGAHSFTVAAPKYSTASEQVAASAGDFADIPLGSATRPPVAQGTVLATYNNSSSDMFGLDIPLGSATRPPVAQGTVLATYNNQSSDTFGLDIPLGSATRPSGAQGSVLATYNNISGTMISGGDNGW